MKKLLLVILVLFGLNQTQAQINYCDSTFMMASTNIPTWPLILTGTANLGAVGVPFAGTVTWNWTVCDANLCFSDTGAVAYFGQISLSDTIKVCYDAYINDGNIPPTTYVCSSCDSLYYGSLVFPDTTLYGWLELNTWTPTGINELIVNKINDGKMYDLLGREVIEPQIGVMYIRNNKKYIRVN